MPFCQACGNSVNTDARFCTACGRPVQVGIPSTPSAASAAVGGALPLPVATSPSALGMEIPLSPGSSGVETMVLPRRRPIGVAVFATLAFLVAALTAAFSLFCFCAIPVVKGIGYALPWYIELINYGIELFFHVSIVGQGEDYLIGMLTSYGIAILLFTLIFAAACYGLWKLRKWGRILAIVLAAFGVLHEASLLSESIWHLAGIGILIWMVAYFFKHHIKQAFGVAA